jgi:hypothetical protein
MPPLLQSQAQLAAAQRQAMLPGGGAGDAHDSEDSSGGGEGRSGEELVVQGRAAIDRALLRDQDAPAHAVPGPPRAAAPGAKALWPGAPPQPPRGAGGSGVAPPREREAALAPGSAASSVSADAAPLPPTRAGSLHSER